MEDILVSSVDIGNTSLKNDYFRMLILIVSGVFIGYTLQPVPKWLNNLFDTSNVFKFFVLFAVGSIAVYPLNKNNIVWVTTASIGCLYLFHLARLYDQKLEKDKKN
jgi:hypothetical protein